MTTRARNTNTLWFAAFGVALAVTAAHRLGAQSPSPTSTPSPTQSPSQTQTPTPTPASDIVVTIPADLLARAGIETAAATTARAAGGVRVPATVQPNAYRQVVVQATAGGRVLAVFAELGQRVNAGDRLIQLHSPEVADAERAYVAVQADLTVARQQVARLERLVTLGAASREELDVARAQQASRAADLQSARAKLLLLGRTGSEVAALTGPDAISATLTLVAPAAGTVTTRQVNAGQTMDAAAPFFTIVDLSSVWIVGDVYERDLAAVRVGSAASISGVAFPGETLSGRVAYIDPQIAADTRTARVRVEAGNAGGRLRLGMLMEMRIGDAPIDTVVVPKSAVQTMGNTAVVYVVNPRRPGVYAERSVRLGAAAGDVVQVLAGLSAGETVVTAGSFLVRSERNRVTQVPPRPVPEAGRSAGSAAAAPGSASSGASAGPRSASSPAGAAVTTVDIAVTEDGFTPAQVTVPANTRIRLRFTRKVEQTCATEVVFAALKIEKPLPLGQAVTIDLPPQPAGRLTFACGMDMYRGQLIIR